MKLDSSAGLTLRHSPGRTGPFLNALSRHLYDGGAKKLSGVKGMEAVKTFDTKGLCASAGVGEEDIKAAAEKLKGSESVSIMAGTDLIRFKEGIAALELLSEVLKALGKPVKIMPILDRCNQRGAWDMGVHPGFGPAYIDTKAGLGCDGMLEAAAAGRIDTFYIVGEDVLSLYPDEGFARDALSKLAFLVVQDIFLSETAKMADLVLPGASFAEKDGTFTNQEGRVQAISRLLPPPGDARTDLEIIGAIGSSISPGFGPTEPDTVFGEIINRVPMYGEVELGEKKGAILKGSEAALEAFKAAEPEAREVKKDEAYPFELVTGNHLFHSGRFSGRAAILKGLSKEATVEISTDDAESLGLSDGDRVKVKGRHYEAELSLKTKKGTKRGVAFIPENFEEVPVNRFFSRGEVIQSVSITPV
jgi:NADH-quinone oxidoreductase subunit G